MSNKILLLENINTVAAELFARSGFSDIVSTKESIDGIIGNKSFNPLDVAILGIRSRSKLTVDILRQFKNLKAIGCFCIGTDQVDLHTAKLLGIPVFNAPFSNTRSVAELVIAEIIMLYRKIVTKNTMVHNGMWDKSADNCREVRGKTLGIIGYGNIGSQVSILAEALGMNVIYYDIENKLPFGSAKKCLYQEELLKTADIVTLHVPQTPLTNNLINSKTLLQMKQGSFLINASRGGVIDIPAFAEALKSGHIAGGAVDVFPIEPKDNKEEFISPLRGFDNVILTPHIGGSTEEAQSNIAVEVADKLVKYHTIGATIGAVNYPEISPSAIIHNTMRILHIHRNIPGILEQINNVMAKNSINIVSQILKTDQQIGYVIIDVNIENVSQNDIKEIFSTIEQSLITIENTIKVIVRSVE